MKTKATKTIVYYSLLIMLLALSFVSCSDSTESKKDNNTPSVTTGNVTGYIRASTGGSLDGATVIIKNSETLTNANGEFLISGISHGTDIVVTISKDGYISTYRTITVIAERTTHITATLFVPQIAWQINPAISNKLEFSMFHDGHIDLPENAFVDSNGNPYNGIVNAAARYFDPTDHNQLASFPGNFSGIQTNGIEVPFESYGFINASFTASGQRGQNLQLAEGKKAELKVPVPPSLAANAPQTMPLWYFDEEMGKWIEDGIGTKVGDYYVGDVTHFSYWNFDVPISPEVQSTLTGKVFMKDQENNDLPAHNAEVIAMGIDYSGYTVARTNNLGEFSITVKASAQVKLNAKLGANSSPSTPVINTPASEGTLEVDDIIIGDMRFRLTGVLKDTSNEPITNLTLVMKQHNPPVGAMPFSVWLETNDEGEFNVQTAFGTPGNAINLIVTSSMHGRRNDEYGYYSNPIRIIVPHPGDTYDFKNIICYPGATVTGRAVDTNGNPFANTGISFYPLDNDGGEELFFWAETDGNGNFKLSGAPNSTIRKLIGDIWGDEQSYRSNPFDVNFPASGQSRSIGNIIFRPVQD